MKKQVLILAIGLLSLASFAQKNELKAIEKAIKKGQLNEAKAAVASLEVSEASIQPKYKAKYYYLKGSCLLYTSPSPRDRQKSRMPSSA